MRWPWCGVGFRRRSRRRGRLESVGGAGKSGHLAAGTWAAAGQGPLSRTRPRGGSPLWPSDWPRVTSNSVRTFIFRKGGTGRARQGPGTVTRAGRAGSAPTTGPPGRAHEAALGRAGFSARSPLLLRLSTHSWAWSFPLWGRGTGRAPRPQEIPARRAGRAARVCATQAACVCAGLGRGGGPSPRGPLRGGAGHQGRRRREELQVPAAWAASGLDGRAQNWRARRRSWVPAPREGRAACAKGLGREALHRGRYGHSGGRGGQARSYAARPSPPEARGAHSAPAHTLPLSDCYARVGPDCVRGSAVVWVDSGPGRRRMPERQEEPNASMPKRRAFGVLVSWLVSRGGGGLYPQRGTLASFQSGPVTRSDWHFGKMTWLRRGLAGGAGSRGGPAAGVGGQPCYCPSLFPARL